MTTPFIRARVSLANHLSLGMVRLRYLDGGAIELDDGRRYGPGAIYSIEPVKEATGPTPEEIEELGAALGAVIQTFDDGRWCVQSDRTIEDHSIYAALAKAIDWALACANAESAELRERLAKAEAGDAMRAQRLLDAVAKLEGLGEYARILHTPGHASAPRGAWTLSVNWQPDAVKGSLDEVIAYILNDLGKPTPVAVETPTEAPPVAPEVEPTVEPTVEDDGTPF